MIFWKKWFWKQNKEVLFIVIFSCLIGFLITSELSFVMQNRSKAHFLFFPLKYLIFVFLGIIIFSLISGRSWEQIKKISPKMFLMFLFLTFLTLIIGQKNNGVRRWIIFGPICLQSSEFLKILILYMNANYLAENNHKMCLICLGVTCVSLLLQPDLGMTLLTLISSGAQIFAVKKNIKFYLKLFVIILICLVLSGVFLATYAKNRLLIFLGKKQGFQVIQGLKMLKKTSIFGAAVDIYIPDSHCDFVFTEICGFFGIIVAVVIICLPIILNRSLWSYFDSKTFENDSKQIFLFGLGAQYFIQTYIHILSNLVIIPTKGMNLPLISFGGSNVMSYLLLFGFISCLTKKKSIT